MSKLYNISNYSESRIKSKHISLENYVTTDRLLQNEHGRTLAKNLPPQSCSLIAYHKNDILLKPSKKEIEWRNKNCLARALIRPIVRIGRRNSIFEN